MYVPHPLFCFGAVNTREASEAWSDLVINSRGSSKPVKNNVSPLHGGEANRG
jgi:hypothetical protein